MAKVEVYTKDYCPYCVKAINLLQMKKADFVEFDITRDMAKQREMLTRAPNARTVPQIFINGAAIGGCDDLYALDAAGKLDTMLQGS